MTSVAAESWKEGWANFRPPRARLGARTFEIPASQGPEVHKLYHSMVEIIDPSTGQVVKRTLVDRYVMLDLPGNRFAAYTETADGEPVIEILEFRLRR